MSNRKSIIRNPSHEYIEDQYYVKSVQILFFSGPYFTVFGVNSDIYSVNLRIQYECTKIGTTKNSVFGHFSRSTRVNHKRFM